MSIPAVAPSRFTKGTTVKWTLRPPSSYLPDDGWILTYHFSRSDDHQFVTGTDNGDGTYLVTITADVSRQFAAGHYTYAALVEKGDEVYQIDRGQVDVIADLTVAVDARSYTKQLLDAVRALMTRKISRGDVASYSAYGRSLSNYEPSQYRELEMKLAADYERELRAERLEKGLGTTGKVRVRFI